MEKEVTLLYCSECDFPLHINKDEQEGYYDNGDRYCSESCWEQANQDMEMDWQTYYDRYQSDEVYWSTWLIEPLDDINEDGEREKTVCIGCGEPKDKGLIVCWSCFKYVDNPFKESSLPLKEWVKERK